VHFFNATQDYDHQENAFKMYAFSINSSTLGVLNSSIYLIKIAYISIGEMLVDPLTMGLRPIVFVKHVENISIVKSFDVFG